MRQCGGVRQCHLIDTAFLVAVGGFVHAGDCLEEGTVAPWPLPLSFLPTLREAAVKQFVFCLWREMLLFVLSWGRLQLVSRKKSSREQSDKAEFRYCLFCLAVVWPVSKPC